MSRKYKIRDQQKLYFLTFSVVRWVDAFSRREYKDIFLDSLRYCQQNKRLELYAFCIMPNHVHLIAGVSEGGNLSAVMRDLKKYTSTQMVQAISNNVQESRREWMLWLFRDQGRQNPNNNNYQFWQQESHAVELNNNEMLNQKLEYIHQNPVRAGICYTPEDYIYSSARQYVNGETVLPVILLE